MTVTFSREEKKSGVYRYFLVLNGRKPSREEYDYWFNESVDKTDEQLIGEMRNMTTPCPPGDEKCAEAMRKGNVLIPTPGNVNPLGPSTTPPALFNKAEGTPMPSFANSGEKKMQSASIPKLGHLIGGKSFLSITRPTQSTTVASTSQPTWASGFRPAPTAGTTIEAKALILPTTAVNNNPITGADAIGLNKPPLVAPKKEEKEPAKTKTHGLHLGVIKQAATSPPPKPCGSTTSPSCRKKQASYKMNSLFGGLFKKKA